MRSVAITGGTGALGRSLAKRLLALGVGRIVILSRDEFKQAEMAAEFNDPRLRFMLADVRDRDRLALAFHGCDLVVAAAALKRVDKVVYDPEEAIKTNILGTANTVRAALEAGVRKVVLISSDKSVEGSTLYGGTKFVAEQYAVAANSYTSPQGTLVAAVRYGNVIDSRGAVLHTFRAQAAQGGPLTLTDQRMTRFIMTLADAVDLVLLASTHMRGGEIFVPKAPSARLMDLAEAVAPGVPRTYTGLRPGGEKLAEVLISEHEADRVVWVPSLGVYVVEPSHAEWGYLPWAGDRLAPDYRYDSRTNPVTLGVDDLRKLVEGL